MSYQQQHSSQFTRNADKLFIVSHKHKQEPGENSEWGTLWQLRTKSTVTFLILDQIVRTF